jgi:hypothetical protein
MRVEYEIEGKSYRFRTFTLRDIGTVSGKLGILPTAVPSGGGVIWRSNDLGNGLLALCSKGPIITTDDPLEPPGDGIIPVAELSDTVYAELVKRLAHDSGFGTEAAEAIRPSSETKEPSEPSTPSA